MRVTGQRESTEPCTEAGWSAYDLLLDEPVGQEHIYRLGTLGNLTYLRMLKEPFYRIEQSYYMIKGLEGKKTLRVSMLAGEEGILERVREQLEGRWLPEAEPKETISE